MSFFGVDMLLLLLVRFSYCLSTKRATRWWQTCVLKRQHIGWRARYTPLGLHKQNDSVGLEKLR